MSSEICQAQILPLPYVFERPRIYKFPTRGRQHQARPASAQPADAEPATVSSRRVDARDAELHAVRDRLFRMIVANQWNRPYGNRAS